MKQTGHPKALPYLFLTEMWERFGFYVVQGMLVLYMANAFGFSDDQSYTIWGVFSALAYIAPMVGGWLADSILGFKTAIVWGGLLLCLGYGMLAVPGFGTYGFYLSLATIIVGNGLFKPNISSLLGALYQPGDSARDSGFTLFYVGINLGVLLAGISSGIIKDYFGWHASFGLASIGLIIGLITFAIGLKWGDIKYQSLPLKKFKFLNKSLLLLYCLITIVLISFLLQNNIFGKWLLPCVGIILLFFMINLAMRQNAQYRNQIFTLIFLIISAIIFWMIFLQIFSSANLFIDRLVDRNIFGFKIPTTVFYTLESIFVILLGPGLAWSWQTLTISDKNPSPIIKFTLAIIFLGLSFAVLAMSTYFLNSSQLINPSWIVLSYLLLTIGEMLLSPIGLSAVTMLSPPHLTGMMMGMWFVALGFGGQFAGLLAKFASVPAHVENTLSLLPIYRQAFLTYAYIAFGVAIGLFILQFVLRNLFKTHKAVTEHRYV